MGVFSNRGYHLKLISATITIVLLCLYANIAGPHSEITLEDCMVQPDMCEGQEIVAVVRRVEAVTPAGLEIRAGPAPVLVTGAVIGDRSVDPGQWIDVRGRFWPPNRLQASALHVHRYRRLKILVSLMPLPLMFLLLVRTVALRPGRHHLLALRTTDHA